MNEHDAAALHLMISTKKAEQAKAHQRAASMADVWVVTDATSDGVWARPLTTPDVQPSRMSVAIGVHPWNGDEVIVLNVGGLSRIIARLSTKLENDPEITRVDGVSSVNGQSGSVSLTTDEIPDTSATHKYVTAADLANLSNLSGVNTGDQDLSGYYTASQVDTLIAGAGAGSFPGYGGDGSAITVSRSDHTHAGYALTSSLAGVALSGAYADLSGKPTIPTTLAQLDTTVTGAQLNALKTKVDGIASGATANSSDATLLNRANHTGTQSADTVIDGTTNKAYTAAEKTKLAGIAAGATANATDAQLRDRATHTGAQAISTVTGLQAALDAKADDTDLASYLTTAAAPELIRDTMGTALVAGTNVTITPNDVGDTITIAASGGGGTNATNLTATVAPTQITVNSDTGTDAVLPAADATNAGLLLPAEKSKLAGIAAGAEVNVQSDWEATSGDAAILNKPIRYDLFQRQISTVGTNTSITTHAFFGSGTLTVAAGTYYVQGLAHYNLKRSVATGEMFARMRIGGVESAEIGVSLSVAGLPVNTWFTVHDRISLEITTTGTVTIEFGCRGATTAGTTSIYLSGVTGSMTKIA